MSLDTRMLRKVALNSLLVYCESSTRITVPTGMVDGSVKVALAMASGVAASSGIDTWYSSLMPSVRAISNPACGVLISPCTVMDASALAV